MPMGCGLANLDDAQSLQILLFLPPVCAARTQATSRSAAFARAAAPAPGSSLWAGHVARVFGLPGKWGCRGPGGEDCGGNWARVFALWQAAALEVGLRDGLEGGLELQFETWGHGAVKVPLPARWIALWRRMLRFLGDRGPTVLETLRPGVQRQDLLQAGKWLEDAANHMGLDSSEVHGFLARSLTTILGMWQAFDGQDCLLLSRDGLPNFRTGEFNPLGVFGGYTAYDHKVSTMMLPLGAALTLTKTLIEHEALDREHSTKLAFACTQQLHKVFLVDVVDGAVYVWTQRRQQHRSLGLERASTPFAHDGLCERMEVQLHGLQARQELNGTRGTLVQYDEAKERWQVRIVSSTATHLLKSDNLEPLGGPEAKHGWPREARDGLLCWFEDYVRRLEGGLYAVRPLRPEGGPSTAGICLLPTAGAEYSSCVTHGIEVTGSCVYMPEHPQGWAYSISFRLVADAPQRGYETCQLYERIWEIQEDGRPPEVVRGEGVIGLFPILADGGWLLSPESDPHGVYGGCEFGLMEGPFRYQSCAGRTESMLGHFGGELTFVPGTRRRPTGKPFQVRLERFRLRVPTNIH